MLTIFFSVLQGESAGSQPLLRKISALISISDCVEKSPILIEIEISQLG